MTVGQQQFRDFLKTKGILTTMTLGAQGWNPQSVDAEQLLGDRIYVYVLDFESRWSWMACTPLPMFQTVATHFKKTPKEWIPLRNTLGTTIQEQAKLDMNQASEQASGVSTARPGKPQQWEQELGLLMAGYAGTTKTANTPGAVGPGCHFLVHRYVSKKGETMLRPYLTGPEDSGALTADRFLMLADHVIRMDQTAHPEWFR